MFDLPKKQWKNSDFPKKNGTGFFPTSFVSQLQMTLTIECFAHMFIQVFNFVKMCSKGLFFKRVNQTE